MWELGAQFAIQGGLGIVEGGSIPYKPEALAKKMGDVIESTKGITAATADWKGSADLKAPAA